MMADIDFAGLNNAEVLGLYARVMEELQVRGLTHSTNNPVANLAEKLVVGALSLKAKPESTKGHDAVCVNGFRYEIKGRRPTEKNKSRQLSFLRELDKGHFDFLVGVLFGKNLEVLKACIVPHATVLAKAKYNDYAKAWIFHLKDDVWGIAGVRDITDEIKKVQG
jgi:hypothetical protein